VIRAPKIVRMLTPGEVAVMFRVDPKTVTRWAAAGKVPSIRTPGGHRRFREDVVKALLNGQPMPTSIDDVNEQGDSEQ
jgi:excisionase family DNA binding protein